MLSPDLQMVKLSKFLNQELRKLFELSNQRLHSCLSCNNQSSGRDFWNLWWHCLKQNLGVIGVAV
ncbi:hypothetical protein PtA15_6A610 [Puccinia triticina]|uniref:Uncharacterized protein n=1 Tax=Puccinia triticina TaxID=208348 RepID=A0ABY7CMP3_9BASI|nr:uncharacterized protein PtA15_6A610 [Puccinia triticina]WAQ85980.1 hypothetical protein PtA15_6A610 [Puccinia triticina]WAR55879.1 hypothetical protein PtB15_6B623 [Puccinia triticina]